MSVRQLSSAAGAYRPPSRPSPPRTVSNDTHSVEIHSKKANKTLEVQLLHIAVLLKLHFLDQSTLARIDHLVSDLVMGDAHMVDATTIRYHLALLYDANLVNSSEVLHLQNLAQRGNRQGAGAAGAISLFPFTAREMHT